MRRLLERYNNKGIIRDISMISKRKKTHFINDLFKNENDKIEYGKIKMGIYWRADALHYKFKDNGLELARVKAKTQDEFNAFLTSKNIAIKIVDHPTFVLEFSKNGSSYIVYFTKTHGATFRFVYFDVSKNRIFIREQLINTIDLKKIKIGGININTTGENSIEEYILKNEDNCTYYEFNDELNWASINEIESCTDREVLENLLMEFDCYNFAEVKTKLLDQISEKAQLDEIPVTYNGVNVTKGLKEYTRLNENQKEELRILKVNFVECFIEVMEKQ